MDALCIICIEYFYIQVTLHFFGLKYFHLFLCVFMYLTVFKENTDFDLGIYIF